MIWRARRIADRGIYGCMIDVQCHSNLGRRCDGRLIGLDGLHLRPGPARGPIGHERAHLQTGL